VNATPIAWLRRHGIVVALLALVVAIAGWTVVFIAAQPLGLQFVWVLRVVAFLGGVVVLPLAAYSGLVPGMVSGPFVTLYGAVATLARPVTRFWVDASGEYHAERSEHPDGPTYSFLFGEVWFDWERSDDCLPPTAVEEVDTDALEGDTLTGERAAHGPERGGHETYIRTDWEGTKFIQVGEVLEDFRDRALELVNDVQDYALRQHGGDTSGHSPRLVLVGVFAMAFMGLLMGYVVYF